MMKRILFQGKEYLMVDNVITSDESYRAGTASYAYLCDNGTIWRYHQKIGTKDEIELIREIQDIKPTEDGMESLRWGWEWAA